MNEREARGKLAAMLTRLRAWAIELDKIEEPSPADRTRPLPPARESDIAAKERRLRFKFPPGYRAFLKLHDGWRNFSFDWWLLGVSSTPAAEKEWRRDATSFEKECRKRGATTIAELRSASKTDAAVMYWPDHVPFAVDFNGGFMVFDRNRRHKDGEYEVVEIRHEEVDRRLPHFMAFVEWAMSIAQRELKLHGREPDSISPVPLGVVRGARRAGGTGPMTRRKTTKEARR